MIATTDGQRWHAYADGEYVGAYPSRALAHAAATAHHEQTIHHLTNPPTEGASHAPGTH